MLKIVITCIENDYYDFMLIKEREKQKLVIEKKKEFNPQKILKKKKKYKVATKQCYMHRSFAVYILNITSRSKDSTD